MSLGRQWKQKSVLKITKEIADIVSYSKPNSGHLFKFQPGRSSVLELGGSAVHVVGKLLFTSRLPPFVRNSVIPVALKLWFENTGGIPHRSRRLFTISKTSPRDIGLSASHRRGRGKQELLWWQMLACKVAVLFVLQNK